MLPTKRLVHSQEMLLLDMGLTHWDRATHICVSKLTIIGSDNGLSPGRCQAIIWTNAGILLIGPLGTHFSEMLSEIHAFSFKKMYLKMSSGQWCPFCLGPNELMACHNNYARILRYVEFSLYESLLIIAYRAILLADNNKQIKFEKYLNVSKPLDSLLQWGLSPHRNNSHLPARLFLVQPVTSRTSVTRSN